MDLLKKSGNAGLHRLAFLFLCALLSVSLGGCGGTGAKTELAATAPAEASSAPLPAAGQQADGDAAEAASAEDTRTPEERLADDIRAGQISWENAPRIGDRDALMAYIRRVRDARLAEAPVVYTGGYMADYEEILKAVNLAYIDFEIRAEEEDSYRVLYTLTYYPGERVADAYLSGSTEGLGEEELALYREAVFLVEEAKKLPSDLHRELFLHDQVIGRATYHNRRERVGVPRFCTALGAMLDGQANCQGYTDAFSMLGTMAGLTIGKQSGFANGEEHVWNTVCLGGRWYALDCTWDDASYLWNGTEYTSYTYFNAPLSVLQATHSYEDYTVEHAVVETLDDAPDYFFLTAEATDRWFGRYFPSMDELSAGAAACLERGARFVYAMAPSDVAHYQKYSAVARGIDSYLKKSADYVVILTNSGDYSFVIVDASGGEEPEDSTQSGNAAESAEAEAPGTSGAPAGAQGDGAEEPAAIEEDGIYTSAEDVALYLRRYGKLPRNFITKQEARALGWEGGGLEDFAPGKCIGGDRFGNYEGLLPEGRSYHECDIDTLGARSRGAKRIIYADDGSIYYTEDHYASFTQLWP